MRKKLIHITLILVCFCSNIIAGETDSPVDDIYNGIHFTNHTKLDKNVFAIAYKGYLKLKQEQRVNTEKDILTICDFRLSANKYRIWVIDLTSNEVMVNDYVAHGQGSGEEYATAFSNKNGSHQSSLGFYITGNTYTGKHGNSLYLHGMDKGYNSEAYKRAIVMHGAGYVSKDFVLGTGRLGRSWGCPALSNEISDKVINLIKDGTCLFIYYPDQKYLNTCYWLH